MAKVVSVGISKAKGTRKDAIARGDLRESYGMVGDAHADSTTHRQVSLLARESIEKMRQQGYQVGPGDFAENITCEGIDLVALPVGTRVAVGDSVVLEISQIGKECHTGCSIFLQTGKCIMPKEGVFARVVRGGTVSAGDEIGVLETGVGN